MSIPNQSPCYELLSLQAPKLQRHRDGRRHTTTSQPLPPSEEDERSRRPWAMSLSREPLSSPLAASQPTRRPSHPPQPAHHILGVLGCNNNPGTNFSASCQPNTQCSSTALQHSNVPMPMHGLLMHPSFRAPHETKMPPRGFSSTLERRPHRHLSRRVDVPRPRGHAHSPAESRTPGAGFGPGTPTWERLGTPTAVRGTDPRPAPT